MNYKEGYEKLQKIVEEMNSGDLSIEEMVDKYEEGISLYKDLNAKLSAFEQRVSLLSVNEDSEIEELEYDSRL